MAECKEEKKDFQTEGKWEGVPYMWAIGRERAWAKGRVWSEGFACGEDQRLSRESGREYRGGVSWKGRWGQSC